MPADKDLCKDKLKGASMEHAKLEGADMSDCKMSRVNLGRADLRKTNLDNAMLKDSILSVWNNGLLEGVRLTGATVWMPANKDLSNAKLQDADLSSCDLSGVNLSSTELSGANLLNTNMKIVNLSNDKLHNAHLSEWSSGLMEGTKLAGSEGWVPADKDLSNQTSLSVICRALTFPTPCCRVQCSRAQTSPSAMRRTLT